MNQHQYRHFFSILIIFPKLGRMHSRIAGMVFLFKEEIMSILAVGFDLDDTLYNRNQIYKKVFETMEHEIIKTGLAFETFNPIFHQHSEAEYELYMQGKKTKDEYSVNRVILAYQELGFAISEEEGQYFNELYYLNQLKIELSPGVVECIEFLNQKNIKTFILTNGSSIGQQRKLEILGMSKYVSPENFFVSGELKLSKPDPALFHYIAEKLAVPADQILYIGDNLINDVHGALQAGWQAIWLHECAETQETTTFQVKTTFTDISKFLEACI